MVEQKYSVGVADNNHSFSVRLPKRATKSNKSDVISASISFLERGLPTKLHMSLAKALADHLGDDLFNEAYDYIPFVYNSAFFLPARLLMLL